MGPGTLPRSLPRDALSVSERFVHGNLAVRDVQERACSRGHPGPPLRLRYALPGLPAPACGTQSHDPGGLHLTELQRCSKRDEKVNKVK